MSDQSFISRFFSFERQYPGVRKWVWKSIYNFLAWRFKTPEWIFMNYGYAELADDEANKLGWSAVQLAEHDEPNRYFIQLYHHLIQDHDLTGLRVLEVGSGRGGGSAWIARSQSVEQMVGVDLSSKAVQFCQKRHAFERLQYQQGDAENLPFNAGSFDIVINLESSHHYPSFTQFLAQVDKVLKPGGFLLLADYRDAPEVVEFQSLVKNSPFTMLKEEDITDNVVAALALDDERKQQLINKYVPTFLKHMVRTFAGMSGTEVYQRFADRRLIYLNYVLQKPSNN